jgi:hypothetical protein
VPADATVVSFMQGFRPGTSISSEIHWKGAIFSHPWLHHLQEESQSYAKKELRRPSFHLHHGTS